MSYREYDKIDPRYEAWRASVFKRDKFKCQLPNCQCKKGRIQAHHIKRYADFPMLRYSVDNGITLHNKCHRIVTGNEQAYEAVFAKKVRENKK